MASFVAKLKLSYLWLPLLLLGANSLIVAETPLGLRYAATLILLAFLPGWVWLRAFFNPHQDDTAFQKSPRLDLLERLTLAIGLSLALTIIGAMFAVYLPGPLAASQLLLIMDTIILAGLAILWWLQRPLLPSLRVEPEPQSTDSQVEASHSTNFPPARLFASPLILLIALLLLAALLRLPRLGYAEFHEDEAEALMLGVRLMQGEDYALFLHRKGPAQMLLPLAFWLLTGQISEGLARFPFALSSILSVAALFFMERRWFNGTAGAIAALLWAINGYAIAFGRMVQYQALIFFLGPLVLYCLYLASIEEWKNRRMDGWKAGRWLILGAILLATCLLAHFDALLLLPAAGYLGWIAVRRRGEETRRRGDEVRDLVVASAPLPLRSPASLLSLLLPPILFLALLASFYIPFLLDPEFKNTANYLAESRVKPGLLYNNLDLLRRLDKDYSSQFYLPLLALGLTSFVIWPGLTHKKWGEAFASVETRAAWLMFGAGFIGYVFLVNDPRTHLYIMYPGAVLLAGAGWAALNFRFSPLHLLGVLLCIILVCLIILYETIIFLPSESTLDQLRQRWDGSMWQVLYHNLPKTREYFGYPKREGWKAIGALRAEGLFPGDFRSVDEDFIIPIWYNYGQARSCYDTPAQFFVRAPGIDFYIPEPQIQNYGEVGWIEREGEVRLRVFSALDLPGSSKAPGKMKAPPIYMLEALAPAFDQLATPQRFIQQAEPSRPVGTQFGPAIQFVGYDLPAATVAPGETLYLNLYWRALQPPGNNYRAFAHLTDGTNLWAQQDDDPACRLPTSIWRAGQRGLGQFRLPIKPETPPGRYPLIIGLYGADTLERLKITAGAGQVGDDFLWLGDVEVIKKIDPH
jgi:hypothetical protein